MKRIKVARNAKMAPINRYHDDLAFGGASAMMRYLQIKKKKKRNLEIITIAKKEQNSTLLYYLWLLFFKLHQNQGWRIFRKFYQRRIFILFYFCISQQDETLYTQKIS